MESINGIDVFLLLSLLAALFYVWHLRGYMAVVYLDGYLDGNRVRRYTDLQQTSQTGDVYDWERDGL